MSIGQDAATIGSWWPLRRADIITSMHHGHHLCLAKALDPKGMFAELLEERNVP